MSDEMKQIEEAQAKLAKMEEDLKGQADPVSKPIVTRIGKDSLPELA